MNQDSLRTFRRFPIGCPPIKIPARGMKEFQVSVSDKSGDAVVDKLVIPLSFDIAKYLHISLRIGEFSRSNLPATDFTETDNEHHFDASLLSGESIIVQVRNEHTEEVEFIGVFLADLLQ